ALPHARGGRRLPLPLTNEETDAMIRATRWAGFLLALTLLGACAEEGAPRPDVGIDPVPDASIVPFPDAGLTLPGGACGAQDAPILSGDNGTPLEDTLRNCVFPVATGGTPPSDPHFPEEVSACLAGEEVGMSAGCADCYGAFAQCNATQCLYVCVSDP